jgi:hypothetical protein
LDAAKKEIWMLQKKKTPDIPILKKEIWMLQK